MNLQLYKSNISCKPNLQRKMFVRIKKLKSMSPMSAEAVVETIGLDDRLSRPNKSKINTDLNNAQKILDEDHYGFQKKREYRIFGSSKRIQMKGPILCLWTS